MRAHAETVALEENGIAVEHKAGVAAHVAAAGEVDDVAAIGRDEADAVVGVVAVGGVGEGEPLAVGAPAEIETAAAREPRRAVGYLADGLRRHVHHHEVGAVLNEGKLLAVGRELRVTAVDGEVGQEWFFVDEGGIGEVGVFAAGNFSRVKLRDAVALAGIDDRTVVLAEIDATFGSSRESDALGGGIFHGGDEHFATDDEGHLLAVGADGSRRGARGERHPLRAVLVVASDIDGYLTGCAARGGQGVDFAVPGETEGVCPAAEEAHGMGGEGGDGCHGLGIVEGEGIDVEGCLPTFRHRMSVGGGRGLADAPYRTAVSAEDGVAVLAGAGRQISVLPRGHVVAPHVAGDGRDVVFAPFVLHTLAVLVQEKVALRAVADHLGRGAEHLYRLASRYGDGIELAERRGGEQGTLGRVLNACAEEHLLPVRGEGRGCLASRVEGEPRGAATRRRHHEHIEVAVTVAGKGNLLPVGAPDGVGFVAVLRGEADSRAACGSHGVDVAHVAEGNLTAVRRDLDIAQPQRGDSLRTNCGNHNRRKGKKMLFHILLSIH